MVILIQLKDTVLHKVRILLLSKKKKKKKVFDQFDCDFILPAFKYIPWRQNSLYNWLSVHWSVWYAQVTANCLVSDWLLDLWLAPFRHLEWKVSAY